MMAFDFSVISWTARQAKSISFSGCPSAKLPLPPVCPVSVPAVAYPRRTAAASAPAPMAPDHPPLPLAWNLPFQAASVAGIHTSILISESLDGRNVAATRHDAGRSPSAGARRAEVIVVASSFRLARLSQSGVKKRRAARISMPSIKTRLLTNLQVVRYPERSRDALGANAGGV